MRRASFGSFSQALKGKTLEEITCGSGPYPAQVSQVTRQWHLLVSSDLNAGRNLSNNFFGGAESSLCSGMTDPRPNGDIQITGSPCSQPLNDEIVKSIFGDLGPNAAQRSLILGNGMSSPSWKPKFGWNLFNLLSKRDCEWELLDDMEGNGELISTAPEQWCVLPCQNTILEEIYRMFRRKH